MTGALRFAPMKDIDTSTGVNYDRIATQHISIGLEKSLHIQKHWSG